MLFLCSLNTLLSGSALLSARDKNLSTWYQVTRSPEKNDQRVNVLGQFQLHLTRCGCVLFLLLFFQAPCASFSRQNLHRVYHSNLLCGRGNLLFIALCVGMQGRKEEGKTMVSMETRPKKPTQSRCHFCLVLDHQNCLTADELSVSGEGISRGLLIKTLSSFFVFLTPPPPPPVYFLFLFFYISFSEQISSISLQYSVNSGGQLFRFRASAVSVNQCMGPEGKKQGEKEIRRRRGEKRKKCRPSLYRTGAQKREEYSLLLSHAIFFTLFLSCQRHNKAQQT